MKCVECESFRILYEPIKGYDSGLAKCDKHDMVAEFTSRRKLNRLVCVEDGGCQGEHDADRM